MRYTLRQYKRNLRLQGIRPAMASLMASKGKAKQLTFNQLRQWYIAVQN